MNWVDLAVILVLLVSALLAFARGLVREVLGISSWVAAAVFATWVFPSLRRSFGGFLPQGDVADIGAFFVAFVIALFFLTIASGAAARAVQDSVLGGVDRTFGLLFGLVRGALILIVAYIMVGLAVPLERWPQPVQDARLMPYIYRGAVIVTKILPETFRPSVSVPLNGPDTSAADLLRLIPQGRAILRH